MTLQNVQQRFEALAELSGEGAAEWSTLVCDAFEDIRRRVSEGCDTQENSRCLEAAAAALAFYNYKTVLGARENTTSFKAGELSFRTGGGVNEAYALFLRSLEPCAGLFREDELIFGRMETLCTET